jgi:thioredoxin reductase (NADPH)
MTEQTVDVLIVGAGPAGLQAAMHAARKKVSVLVVGRVEQSAIARAHVENYLCVDGVHEGHELLAIGLAQISRLGVDVLAEDVLHIEQDGEEFVVAMESGDKARCQSLIFATGTSRKKLKVPGEKSLLGKGVSYCVDCDANFFRNAKVAVVGNESGAVDGALTLTKYASEVHLVAEKLTVTKALGDKLAASTVQVHADCRVKEIAGDTAVTGLVLGNNTTLTVEGVFIELGAKGAVQLATTMGIMLDSETFSHIQTDKKQATNLVGVYAAGDIAGPPWQMAKAVGEGCVAGWEAANYVNQRRRAGKAEE